MRKIQLTDRFRQHVRARCWVAVALTLLLIGVPCQRPLAGASWANQDATVRIDPSTQEVAPGGTATTEVLIEDVTDGFAFEFQLTFDTAVVNGVEVKLGNFLDPGGFGIEPTIDNSGPTGTVAYAYTQLGGTPKTGSGVLAVITWQGVATGTSALHFEALGLAAPGPVAIPTTAQDGEIVVTGEAPSDYFVYLPLTVKER